MSPYGGWLALAGLQSYFLLPQVKDQVTILYSASSLVKFFRHILSKRESCLSRFIGGAEMVGFVFQRTVQRGKTRQIQTTGSLFLLRHAQRGHMHVSGQMEAGVVVAVCVQMR